MILKAKLDMLSMTRKLLIVIGKKNQKLLLLVKTFFVCVMRVRLLIRIILKQNIDVISLLAQRKNLAK